MKYAKIAYEDLNIFKRVKTMQTTKTNESLKFTLIEIMIIVVVIMILAAILLPQLARSKEFAQAKICMSNARQVALGYQNYMHDFDGEMPYPVTYFLDDFQMVYMYCRKKDEIFTCPKSGKPPWSVWDEEGNLRGGDFMVGGKIEDIENNHNYNNGKGNNPYHFDPSNPSPQTRAVMATKRMEQIVYEKYWGLHFNGMFFNVVHIGDLHAEIERNGYARYWSLDDRGWIETSLDPFPEESKNPESAGVVTPEEPPPGGGGGGGLGDCPFCGGDGVKDNGKSCNKCGGDGWL